MQTLHRLNTPHQLQAFRQWPFTARGVSIALSGSDPDLQRHIATRINAHLAAGGCGHTRACVLIVLLLTAPTALWAGISGQAAPLPLAVGLLAMGLAAATTGQVISALHRWRKILRELDRLESSPAPQPSTRITSLVGS